MTLEKTAVVRLSVKLRNNRILALCEERGLCMKEAARMAGVSYAAFNWLVSLRQLPRREIRGEWKWNEVPKKLAQFFGVPVAELFPEVLEHIKEPSLTREIGESQLRLLMASTESIVEQTPEDLLGREEELRQLNMAMDVLSPRETAIVLGRAEGATLAQIAEAHALSGNRISQIEARAHRKLRIRLRQNGVLR